MRLRKTVICATEVFGSIEKYRVMLTEGLSVVANEKKYLPGQMPSNSLVPDVKISPRAKTFDPGLLPFLN
jgi:hypothetical protein